MTKLWYNEIYIRLKRILGGKILFLFLYRLTISLFIISLSMYILIVLREKILLKQNIILIDNRYLTQEDIDNTDINQFIYKGTNVRSGDEIKIITKGRKSLNGILIGANKRDSTIHIITHKNEIVKCPIKNISKLKIVNKYGSFLNY